MSTEQYEPVWNGSLEAAGKVAGLSTYTGPSTLAHLQPHRKEKAEGLIVLTPIQVGPLPTPGDVWDRLRRGYSLRAVARGFGISPRMAGKLRDQAIADHDRYAQRKARQVSLFAS